MISFIPILFKETYILARKIIGSLKGLYFLGLTPPGSRKFGYERIKFNYPCRYFSKK